MIAWRAALEQVFHLHNNPQALVAMQQSPLPNGMASLMRLASDSGSLLGDVAQELEMPAVQLQSQVADYLLAVCLYPHSNALRVLGLNDASNMALAKEHHRLLLKWLHPDRNPENKLHAERVNQAWTFLKQQSPEIVGAMALAEQSSHQVGPLPPPPSRFGKFLLALMLLAMLLVSLSFWPDDSVYVHGADSLAQKSSETEVGNDKNELQASWLDRLTTAQAPARVDLPEVAPAVSKPIAALKPTPQGIAVAPQSALAHSTNTNVVPAAVKPIITASSPVSHAITPEPAQPIEPVVSKPNQRAQANSGLDVNLGHNLLERLAKTYQQGDLAAFMALFSAQARYNRSNRLMLEQDYRHLFTHSTRRSIRFSELQWRKQENLTLSAHYESQVKWQDKWQKVRNKGRVELELINDNGQMRIQQILFEE